MWLLQNDLPVIEVLLLAPFTGEWESRTLLADTGAGPRFSPFEIVLSHADIARFGEEESGFISVSGALQGQFRVYRIRLQIPALRVDRSVRALSAPTSSLIGGLDGIAGFRFLNSFSYGNFGNAYHFGLETL